MAEVSTFSPRVRPRPPIEDLVSRETHPPRRKIATEVVGDDRLHWSSQVALVALAVFWVTTVLAAILVSFGVFQAAVGQALIAAASLVVHYRIEAE